MKSIEIKPLEKLDSVINVPGNKYIANRVLIIAALGNGISIIKNIPNNNDINKVIENLIKLGVNIERTGNDLKIQGTNGNLKEPNDILDIGESGTLLRFLIGVCSLVNGKVHITGSKRIQERPVSQLLKGLHDLGINSKSLNNNYPPILIDGGTLKGGTTKIKGNISSQFISSLLLIAPYAKEDVKIIVEDNLVSEKYIDLTIDMMQKFGVNVIKNKNSFLVKANQKYTNHDYTISGDWSSASYFFGAAAILPGSIRINDLDLYSKQGESKFSDLLVKMGCMSRRNSKWLQVIGMANLKNIEIDMSTMPDVVQTLAIIAAFSKGVAKITNIAHLKLKESNRIKDTTTELRKIGIKVEDTNDSMIIYGGSPKKAIINSHNDHRMAMSFAIAGLKTGMIIQNPDCVNKSFPGFWDKLRELGVEIVE